MGMEIEWVYWSREFTTTTHGPSSQARVSALGFRDPGNPAWAEHFSRGGGMTLSQSQLLYFCLPTHSTMCLTLMRFWKADPRSWNRKGCWETVSQSCCLFRQQWLDAKYLYPNKESSLTINGASVKKYSVQARLPGSLKPCAEKPWL